MSMLGVGHPKDGSNTEVGELHDDWEVEPAK